MALRGPKLTNARSRLRFANPKNPTEKCGECVFFRLPNICTIVEGPVRRDQLCDWIQSRGKVKRPQYTVRDEDWVAFVKAMVEEQPYQHIVMDGALTPAGPLVMIKDTVKPEPHFFSLTKEFHVSHTTLEHHWTQEEVDLLIRIGRVEKFEGLGMD